MYLAPGFGIEAARAVTPEEGWWEDPLGADAVKCIARYLAMAQDEPECLSAGCLSPQHLDGAPTLRTGSFGSGLSHYTLQQPLEAFPNH